MTFEELLNEACRSAGLPNTARKQLPVCLSEKTKKMALKMSPEEFGKILSTAIEVVNHGSVESIDVLVRNQIEKR